MQDSSSANRLINAARRGEVGALDQLWQLYRHYLRLLARTGIDASLQGKADPSDLVQETLLKASQNFKGFRGTTEAELATWLRRILAQVLADLVRRYHSARRHVQRERLISELVEGSSASMAGLAATDARRGGLLPPGRDAGVLLAEAMAELCPSDREVITLRNLEQLEWQQVAERMGRTADAVRMQWVRALKRLKPIIEAQL